MTDREIVRELAKQYAEIAHLDSTEKTRKNWGRLLALDNTAKPVIMIDQIPWHEMNINDELTCVCENDDYRMIEGGLRVALYRYKHFKADMVFTPFFTYDKIWSNTGFGIGTKVEDEHDHPGVETHLFVDQISDDEALAKIHKCEIKYDAEATRKRGEFYNDVLGDIMPTRPMGTMIWAAIWDALTFWRGAETCLYSLADEPEFVHRIMTKMSALYMDMIDQLEEQNLLCAGPGAICHCTETYVDEPKWYAVDQDHIKTSDCWISGAAQIFSEVSPKMHDEFEIQYLKPIFDRFGWVNYGCCDPLSSKIDIVKKLNTVRSISASPWTNVDKQAEAMGKDYAMMRKPNPAFVASGYVDDAARREIRHTLEVCRNTGTPVAFILKDITTVHRRPQCLTEWYEMCKAEIENF